MTIMTIYPPLSPADGEHSESHQSPGALSFLNSDKIWITEQDLSDDKYVGNIVFKPIPILASGKLVAGAGLSMLEAIGP